MIADRRILVLSPHPDDAELGCGGTLARFMNAASPHLVLAFSWCEESNPGVDLQHEWWSSLRRLSARGLTAAEYTGRMLPVRRFSEHRQAILNVLIAVRKQFDPEVIFTPATTDLHQDHAAVTQEARRAFKHRTLLGYHLPWNEVEARYDLCVPLTADCMNVKEAALACYESQKHRGYFELGNVDSIGRVGGLRCGHTWAETFEVLRAVE